MISLIDQKIVIHNYLTEFHDLATYKIKIVNYHKLVKQSLEIVQKFRPELKYCLGRNFSVQELDQAKITWQHSLELSLRPGGHPAYTCRGCYSSTKEGFKYHHCDDLWHLEGLCLSKQLHCAGTSMPSSKNLAKEFLRRLTPLAGWVQFRLHPENFEKIVGPNRTCWSREWLGVQVPLI